jgi:hypothetical protein
LAVFAAAPTRLETHNPPPRLRISRYNKSHSNRARVYDTVRLDHECIFVAARRAGASARRSDWAVGLAWELRGGPCMKLRIGDFRILPPILSKIKDIIRYIAQQVWQSCFGRRWHVRGWFGLEKALAQSGQADALQCNHRHQAPSERRLQRCHGQATSKDRETVRPPRAHRGTG